MSLKFLSISEAKTLIQNTSYFSQMSDGEIRARLQIAGVANYNQSNKNKSKSNNENLTLIKQLYLNSVSEYTPSEKTVMVQYFSMVMSLLKGKAPLLFPNTQICACKLSGARKLDWNFPYTLNNCIVLPQQFVDLCVAQAKDLQQSLSQKSNTVWNLYRPQLAGMLQPATTIAHEILHIVQRYPTPQQSDLMSGIYSEWKFKRLHPKNIKYHTTDARDFLPVTNPDGVNYTWAVGIWYHNKVNWFAPLLILPDIEYNPTGVLLPLTIEYNGSLTAGNFMTIESNGKYLEMFAELDINSLYHPNEIFATAVSEWLIQDKVYNKLNDDGFYKLF